MVHQMFKKKYVGVVSKRTAYLLPKIQEKFHLFAGVRVTWEMLVRTKRARKAVLHLR